ncbi:MAG: hypothetical protein WC755_05825 [Candidatus Woesearchaeota archaeon]|jgi:hypothetical protein
MDGKTFINEFVVAFGFLSGLWVAVGVNPEAEIFKAFSQVFQQLNAGVGFSFLFTVLPIILTLATLFGIYFLGGWIGVAAVALGFVAGLLIIINPIIAVILLFASLGLGLLAMKD